jgi:hypothetical protein
MTGVPALVGGIPTVAVAGCRERLIRLKPGLLFCIFQKNKTFYA